METKTFNNIRLGIFVLSGLLFLIIMLYMIGKNKNIFGSNFRLRARFENIQGLKAGNNVRFAGIDAGTVEEINIINDTVIEVVMILNKKVKHIIKTNAIVSIGTDGLVGNKVVNITSVKKSAEAAKNNDILRSRKPVDTDEMIRTLHKTNSDAAVIAENLKITIRKINNSEGLWETLNDSDLPENISTTLLHIKQSARKLNKTMNVIKDISEKINSGDGLLSNLINDTLMKNNILQTSVNLKAISYKLDSVINNGNDLLSNINKDINNGPGSLHELLKDSLWSEIIYKSLYNIEKGTNGFNQNMEALKHNFLFRGYFKKIEKQKIKATKP